MAQAMNAAVGKKADTGDQAQTALFLVPRIDPPTLRESNMPEPSSSAAGAGFVAWKAMGGLAVFAGLGALLSTIVAMCMMTPRSPREWAVGLISTVISSLGGGAYVILKFGLYRDLPADETSLFLALVAGLGVVFTCGLPGWALVRALFTWLDRRKAMDLGELVQDARRAAAGAIEPRG